MQTNQWVTRSRATRFTKSKVNGRRSCPQHITATASQISAMHGFSPPLAISEQPNTTKEHNTKTKQKTKHECKQMQRIYKLFQTPFFARTHRFSIIGPSLRWFRLFHPMFFSFNFYKIIKNMDWPVLNEAVLSQKVIISGD